MEVPNASLLELKLALWLELKGDQKVLWLELKGLQEAPLLELKLALLLVPLLLGLDLEVQAWHLMGLLGFPLGLL
jgi:hypothetical protein